MKRGTTLSRIRRCSAGQSLVEMALVLPILLGLVIGIFEFGRGWNVYQVLTNAAREGARRAVLPTGTEAGARQTVTDYLNTAGLDPTDATIVITGVGGGVGTPTSVQLSYPYQFQFLGPIVQFLDPDDGSFPGSVTLSTSVVMRNE